MSDKPVDSRLASRAAALCLILLTAAGMLLFLRAFAPKPAQEAYVPDTSFDPAPMRQAVDHTRVAAEMEAILALGSRALGQDGARAAQEHMRAAFEAAGLEIHVQDGRCAAPVTAWREILAPDGKPLPAVDVYPFMPNQLQPTTTPAEGVTGRLTLATSETLRTMTRFDNCIAVIDTRPRKPAFGLDWMEYARRGFKAAIVTHPEGLKKIRWRDVVPMLSNMPVNYPRVAANERILDYLGTTATLRLRVDYRDVSYQNIFGVLRARNPSDRALMIASEYDATSFLPDRAPGVMQAIGPATQLCVLKGILPYRDSLKRDIVFGAFGGQAMAHDGINTLLGVLGPNLESDTQNPFVKALNLKRPGEKEAAQSLGMKQIARIEPLKEDSRENEARLTLVETLLALFSDPEFLARADLTEARAGALDKETRDFLNEQVRYVLNTLVLQKSEEKLQSYLAFLRDDPKNTAGTLFQDYLVKKKSYDRALAAAGYNVVNLLRRKSAYAQECGLRPLCIGRLEELRDYHLQQRRRIGQSFEMAELFNSYKELVVVKPQLAPKSETQGGQESLAISTGVNVAEAQAYDFFGILTASKSRAGVGKAALSIPPLEDWLEPSLDQESLGAQRSSLLWVRMGYPIYYLVNRSNGDSYFQFGYPVELPFMRDLASIHNSLAVAGQAILSVAHGSGRFPSLSRTGAAPQPIYYGGKVLVANVGQSIVPNYPMKGALLASRGSFTGRHWMGLGFFQFPLLKTNPYGEFKARNMAADFGIMARMWQEGYGPLAVGFGSDGLIAHMKDEGEEGQRLFKSIHLPHGVGQQDRLKNVNLVVFRAAPVTLLDLTNPQTMQDYAGAQLVSQESLTEFKRVCEFRDPGIVVNYISPEERFYVEFLAGSTANELARVTRAFMLNNNPSYAADPDKEIDGQGYLAADSPLMMNVPSEVGRSMTHLNGRRMEPQSRFGMVDERTEHFHERSGELLEEAGEAGLPRLKAARKAREAVTYATLVHPVLRDAVFESVIGILYYLGLLAPFCFFFEKLVFGFADIRRQIAAQSIVFMVVFALLKLLHPAFEMIRSSLMILLGFTIILISGGIAVLFAGKFQENLEGLRKRRGRVRAAEINTMGVIGSAFMLGLNNMHRRKVRTGLTCATLTLLTFAMICFTSVQTDVVDTATPIGKAPFQGFVLKRDKFIPVSEAEIRSIQDRYEDDYEVARRMMFVGRELAERHLVNPIIKVSRGTGEKQAQVDQATILEFGFNEPLRDRIKFLTKPAWFQKEDEIPTDDPSPVFLPDAAAEKLGITPAEVDGNQPVQVRINGKPFVVKGIFDSAAFEKLRDLDGRDLLPFDAEALTTIEHDRTRINLLVADDDSPRIQADRLVILPLRDHYIQLQHADPRNISIAVHMPNAPYKEAKKVIGEYMEQTGQSVYYGLDGIAYKGRRAREVTLAGLLDLLIPLIIAALTVLNAMKGSVYERRDEIFVYNAVGIAPRYVFFMFFAEAFVYAVVGSVLGYLLSQGTGRILTEWNMTGGMNMTFTSTTTIYASLTITIAVLASTYFPARSALQIGAPAEDAGWSLPPEEDDELAFSLPFTFTGRDRVAILAFFERYLQDHGEGGAGRYFSSPPELCVDDKLDPLAGDAYVPAIRSTIWLKPFDLGVSQRLAISLPTDEETREFVARIALTRLSGTRESWLRLNRGFVAEIRRHFLHWRAVSPEERAEMFAEARELLERRLLAGGGPVGG